MQRCCAVTAAASRAASRGYICACSSRPPTIAAAPSARAAPRRRRRRATHPACAAATDAATPSSAPDNNNSGAGAGGAGIEPYIVEDRVVVITAQWDPREHDAGDYDALEAQLARLGAETVDFAEAAGARGPPLVRATATVGAGSPQVADALAAALLAETAAIDVRLSEETRRALPRRCVSVATAHGAVRVHVSLKGAEVFKASPHWPDCERAAAAAADAEPAVRAAATKAQNSGPVSAEDVATEALLGLRAGLEDGSIDLGTRFLF